MTRGKAIVLYFIILSILSVSLVFYIYKQDIQDNIKRNEAINFISENIGSINSDELHSDLKKLNRRFTGITIVQKWCYVRMKNSFFNRNDTNKNASAIKNLLLEKNPNIKFIYFIDNKDKVLLTLQS